MNAFSKFLVSFFLVFCLTSSCKNTVKSSEILPAQELSDQCVSNPQHSYEVYLPVRNKTEQVFPLLILIDAHGDGRSTLAKFKAAATKFPAVVVASNLVKNNFEGFETAIQQLLEDVKQKYPVGEKVYLSGFSGGARMALGYALTHPVNGLILCGALADPQQLQALKCTVVAISGMDDFNFVETAQYFFQEETMPVNLKIELTDASHSWPDSSMLEQAFGYLCLSGSTVESTNSKAYCYQQKNAIDSLKQKGAFLKALLVAKNMASSAPFNLEETFHSNYLELKSNPEYSKQLNTLKENIRFELSVRESYWEALQTKDSLWWKKEITSALQKINSSKDPFEKSTWLRIKGFWGIACYSLCNQAIQQRQLKALKQVLTVYRMLEPENTEMIRYSELAKTWQ